MITNVHRSACKLTVVAAKYRRSLNFLDRFMKSSQIPHFMKFLSRMSQANSRYQKCLHHLHVGTWQNAADCCAWPLTQHTDSTLQAHGARCRKHMDEKQRQNEWTNALSSGNCTQTVTNMEVACHSATFRADKSAPILAILLPFSAPRFKPANKQTLQWSRCSDCELYTKQHT